MDSVEFEHSHRRKASDLGRMSRFVEDHSVAGPSRVANASAEEERSALNKIGRYVASLNPFNVFKTFTRTYDTTTDEITVENVEHLREHGIHTPVPNDTPQEKRSKLFTHLRRASVTNLKKARSEINLLSLGRQSTTSLNTNTHRLSDTPTLKQSASRKSLRHQRKLSKRVSDLEAQLDKARTELNKAIVDTSPLPDLPSRYERYTPNFAYSTAKNRPKFTPGLLPTLPSERLLFPDIFDMQEPDHDGPASTAYHTHDHTAEQVESQDPFTGNELVSSPHMSRSEASEDMDDLPRSSSPLKAGVYMHDNTPIQAMDETPDLVKESVPDSHEKDLRTRYQEEEVMDEVSSEHFGQMEDKVMERIDSQQDLSVMDTEEAPEVEQAASGALQQSPPNFQVVAQRQDKFKSLEKAVKKKKPKKPSKKRKSMDDSAYKPGKEDFDSDDNERGSKLKKRRKSGDVAEHKTPTKPAQKAPKSRTVLKKKTTTTLAEPPTSPRPRHSGEGQRGGLDIIEEDRELEVSPRKEQVPTPTSEDMHQPPSLLLKPNGEAISGETRKGKTAVSHPPKNAAEKRQLAEDMVDAMRLSDAESANRPPPPEFYSGRPHIAVRQPSPPRGGDGPNPLTERNLQRLADFQWPEDVF